MMSAPDAILLPKSLGGATVQQLSAKLAVREAEFTLAGGKADANHRGRRYSAVPVGHGELSRLKRAADRPRPGTRSPYAPTLAPTSS